MLKFLISYRRPGLCSFPAIARSLHPCQASAQSNSIRGLRLARFYTDLALSTDNGGQGSDLLPEVEDKLKTPTLGPKTLASKFSTLLLEPDAF